jgi:hypothetical protein
MLLQLSPEICNIVFGFVTEPSSMRNVLASCKGLQPKQTSHTRLPTHAEQARMLADCDMHWSFPDNKFVVPFDNPFVLELFRAWKAPLTRRALVNWVCKQLIDIDEGGLFACVPWRCELLNLQGVRCFRIRVKLWDHVSTSCRYTRTTWNLDPGLENRAYHPRLQTDVRVADMTHRDGVKYSLRSMKLPIGHN